MSPEGVLWTVLGLFAFVFLVLAVLQYYVERERKRVKREWDGDMDGNGRRPVSELQSRIRLDIIRLNSGGLVVEYHFADVVGPTDRLYPNSGKCIWTGMTRGYLTLTNAEFKSHPQFVGLQVAAKLYLTTQGCNWDEVAGADWNVKETVTA